MKTSESKVPVIKVRFVNEKNKKMHMEIVRDICRRELSKKGGCGK